MYSLRLAQPCSAVSPGPYHLRFGLETETHKQQIYILDGWLFGSFNAAFQY